MNGRIWAAIYLGLGVLYAVMGLVNDEMSYGFAWGAVLVAVAAIHYWRASRRRTDG